MLSFSLDDIRAVDATLSPAVATFYTLLQTTAPNIATRPYDDESALIVLERAGNHVHALVTKMINWVFD